MGDMRVRLILALAGCLAAGASVFASSAAGDGLATVISPAADCTIYSGSPTSNAWCGSGSDDLVGTDGNGGAYRTMFSFPSGLQIPAGSKVLSSTLTITVAGAFGSTPTWVFPMAKAFGPGQATWNTYDGVHAWSTGGGDFNGPLQAAAVVSAPGQVSFSITPMTQSWVDGSDPLPALMVLGYVGSGNAFSFDSDRSASPPTLTIAYQPPSPPPPPPVTTTPTPTPIPQPKPPHALKVKLVLAWTWHGSTTRLRTITIGTVPAHTRLTIRCRGRACPRRVNASATGRAGLRRLLRGLRDRRFHAGDQLLISLTSRGYLPERAKVIFRAGRLPLVKSA
jgi:hypothetical protein